MARTVLTDALVDAIHSPRVSGQRLADSSRRVSFPAMKPERSLFDDVDDAADEAAMLEGEADAAAGRVISNEAMTAWLLSWGTSDELPPPQVGD